MSPLASPFQSSSSFTSPPYISVGTACFWTTLSRRDTNKMEFDTNTIVMQSFIQVSEQRHGPIGEIWWVIFDKKVPTKMKLLICRQTVVRWMLLYGCETWPMLVQDEKRMSTRDGAMGNVGEPIGTPEKWGNLGGSKVGTDSDGYEKEKVGMVRAR